MPTSHLMTITLQDVTPPVWRRVSIPSDTTLAEAQEVLITAMGWEGYHLCQSIIDDTAYCVPDEEWDDDTVDPRSVRLAEVVSAAESFILDYDFGDGWEHHVVVEDVVDSAAPPHPQCLAGRRACPPEDAGGPGGYAELLEALADPGHEEHAAMLEWVGGSFDPDAFDLDAVNARLSRRRRRRA